MASLQRDDDLPETRAPKIGPALARGRTFQTGAAVKSRLKSIIDEKVRQKKNTYQYKDIAYNKEIRLLIILRGKKDDPLECMLFSTDKFSSDGPERNQYWALSYWWGEGQPHIPVKIFYDTGGRGVTQDMTDLNLFGLFHVRDNLATALQQCRHEKKDVNIWVDAICINQENLKEKTAQVARMDEIYSGAENVCVWLGAGNDQTTETFEFLKSILDLRNLDELIKTRESPEKWNLVVKLMQNKWFSRRWVIQELALAKNASVRWGEEEIQWSDFADIIALLMTHHSTIQQMLGQSLRFPTTEDSSLRVNQFDQLDPRALGANTLVNATSNLFRRSSDGTIQRRLMTLEILVSSMFLPFEASDPKDTIYAVLSLAKDTFTATRTWESPAKKSTIFEFAKTALHSCMRILWPFAMRSKESFEKSASIDYRVAPNYKKCLTDVCAHFMEYCIETSKPQSLDILCRHWAPKPKTLTAIEELDSAKAGWQEEKLPSWIPSIEGHAFGGPLGAVEGRKHGDSFVGDLERQHRPYYNASAGLRPFVIFGKYRLNHLWKATQTQGTRIQLKDETSPENNIQNPTSAGPSEMPLPKIFDGTLLVKGLKLAHVEEVSDKVSYGVIPAEALRYGGWNAADRATEVPDQIWRTLVADRGPNGINAPTWYRRACLECLEHIDSLGGLNITQLATLRGVPTTMVTFLERVRQVVFNRRFFTARDEESKDQKDFYGLCPPEAKAGDVICILFGCSVPVLLKPLLNSEKNFSGFYSLIGECYVHGMMDGEAVNKRLEHPYSNEESFVLK